MVSAMRTITIGLSALPQIPGLGCHRWTQLRVIHLFWPRLFFVPSGNETWWKIAMMLDPFSSIFTQYMGVCPGIFHRTVQEYGDTMGIEWDLKKPEIWVCVSENGGIQVSHGIPQYGNFNAKTMRNLWLLGVPILRLWPKSNMISACFSKSPELALNEKSWFYPLVNIQKAIENGHRNSGFTH